MPRGQTPHVPGPGRLPFSTTGAVLLVVGLSSGLVLRLMDLGNSLWLDELSTLWAVEGSLSEVFDRVPLVMGQSPFYFTLVWTTIQVFGEHEWALRLPSLLGVTGATVFIAAAARECGGWRAAAWGGFLFWWCYPAIWSSVDARPYGLAMLFAALALCGWMRTCTAPSPLSRGTWVVGTSGLIWTHYVFTPFAVAAPLSYVLFSQLRRRYRPTKFLIDTLAATLLTLPTLTQFLSVADGRAAQAWALESSHWGVWMLLMPFSLAMIIPTSRNGDLPMERALKWFGLLSIGLQIGALEGMTLLGSDLLAPRYAYVTVVAASTLAGIRLARVRGKDWLGPIAVFALGSGLALIGTLQVTGSWTGAGYQNWRGAVAALEADMARSGSAPVLFRSGNAEDDLSVPGQLGWPATLAPLRQPGEGVPDWQLILLTYRWNSSSRIEYFNNALAARIDDQSDFYLLCLMSEEPDSGGYCPSVIRWAHEQWPGELRETSLGSFGQLMVVRFDRLPRGGSPDP